MTTRPTVSIIIPTYNRAALLPRALDSIIAQTYEDWEIVLVDDGSTDNTDTAAAGYAECLKERLVYLRRPHAGVSAARNCGIDACSGRFVAFLDSDDEYLPTKLERQLALFDLRPQLGLVYGDSAFVDLDGARHDSVFDEKAPMARGVPYDEIAPGLCVCQGDLFDYLIRDYFIATIAGMVRRGVLGETIRFPVDQSYAEEWLFYLKVAHVCHAGFVNEPLCLHHFTSGSLARTNKHRNMHRRRDLLYTIEKSFSDLKPEHSRAIHHNLATTCRQLGFETYRAHRYREAAGFFAESFKNEKRFSAAWETTQAVLRSMVPGSARDATTSSIPVSREP